MHCEKWLVKITNGLMEASTIFVSNVSCHAIWGEVEIPECLRKEAENEK